MLCQLCPVWGVQFESTLGTYLTGLWERAFRFPYSGSRNTVLVDARFHLLNPSHLHSRGPGPPLYVARSHGSDGPQICPAKSRFLKRSAAPSTSDARGTVSSGHVTLRARLFPLQVIYQGALDEQRDTVQYELQHFGKGSSGGTVCYLQPDVPLG
jgi:hypothetical protein